MEKEFIPYKQALALKELGFDEECLAVHRGGSLYGSGTSVNRYYEEGHWQLEKNSDYNGNNWIAAPTFSQAFRWFREKYGDYLLYSFGVIPHFTIIQNLIIEDSEITYEEAELECLKKLIEIVKNKG